METAKLFQEAQDSDIPIMLQPLGGPGCPTKA